MDVKEAVRIAKNYLDELFEGEGLMNIGLEEIVFREISNSWEITLGFSRPWNQKNSLVAAISEGGHPTRSYKVVSINDDDGRVKSLTDRVLPDWQR